MEAINPDWSSLPEDIWYSILEKLESSKDFLRCGVVCHKWHALMKSYKRGFNLLHQAPMLIVPNHTEKNKWNIFDTMNNKKLAKSELVIPYDMSFCGSSLGWLAAVDEDLNLTLFKLFDKERIIAPIRIPVVCFPDMAPNDFDVFQAWLKESNMHVLRAWISADPIENPDDCVVVVMLSETRELAFTRPATHKSWTSFDTPRSLVFYGVVFDDDNLGLHALADYGELAHISLVNLEVKWVVGRKRLLESPYTALRYLAKSRDGELFRVDRLIATSSSGKRETKITRVFKLLSEDEKEPSWVMVKTLGGAALFLGDNSSIYVHASDFVGCRPNCIYFTDDFETIGYKLRGPYRFDLCVYCLEDESYTRHYRESSHNFVTGMKVQPPTWVTPTLNI